MLEVAWLSFLRGEWLLVTGNDERDIRKWEDKELALRDLSDEGWTIISSQPERPGARRNRRLKFPGYCLRRTIH
jgi:hypothetical protein